VLSGVTILFFALDALGKLLQADPVVLEHRRTRMACISSHSAGLARVRRRDAVRIATHVGDRRDLSHCIPRRRRRHAYRVGSPIFTHVLFGVYVAAFMWGGLLLRYPALLTTLTGGSPWSRWHRHRRQPHDAFRRTPIRSWRTPKQPLVNSRSWPDPACCGRQVSGRSTWTSA